MKALLVFGGVTAVGIAFAAYLSISPGKLTYEGKTVSTNFLVQNGKTYVPLEDVASVLNCVIQKSANGIELAPIGKGKMVEGTIGKIGETVGRPEMQFTVTKVIDAGGHYDRKYSPGNVDAYDDNSRLVVVMCRVRNGTPKTINICTVGADKTAIADMDEHTYAVLTGDGGRNEDILPGAVIDFGLVFKVPKSEKLKALVYQTDGFPHPETFRISLVDADPSGR